MKDGTLNAKLELLDCIPNENVGSERILSPQYYAY
jgi:hypothetical protein